MNKLKVVYPGTQGDTGLTLTASLLDIEGTTIQENIPLVEVGTTSLFVSNDLQEVGEPFENGLAKGDYIVRILGESSEQRGLGHFSWDGKKQITNVTIDDKLWTEIEKMQIRDAQGIDGDKRVARDGQLQKKSEEPNNDIIDTNKF